MKKLLTIAAACFLLVLVVSVTGKTANAACPCGDNPETFSPSCCIPPDGESQPLPTSVPAWCTLGCPAPQPLGLCCDTCTGQWGSCGGSGGGPALQCTNFVWDGLNTISGQGGRWERPDGNCLDQAEEVDCTNGGLITRCVNWSASCGYCTQGQLYFKDVDTGQVSQRVGLPTGCYDNNNQDLRNCIDPPIHSGLTAFSYNVAQIMPTVFPQIVNDGHEHHLQLYESPTSEYYCNTVGSVICGYFTYAGVTPTPTPYPNVLITGTLEQSSGGTCYQAAPGSTFTSPNISVVSSPNTCVTPICQALPVPGTSAIGYSCTVKVANQGCATRPTPALTLNLSASVTGYGSGQFAAPPVGGVCSASSTQLAVNAATGPYTVAKDIVFPFTGTNWIKLKGTSFTATSTTDITIPVFVASYGTDDDATQKYFIMTPSANGAEAGAVAGASVGLTPDRYSNTHNWYVNSYTRTINLSAAGFLSYVQSRKDHKVITAADFSEVTANGIYVWGGASPLTISSVPAAFNNYNVVLISNGEVNISTPQFKPTKSVAVIANAIKFSSAVTEATGVFSANTVDTGTTVDQGLQITGNLSTQTLTNGRSWINTSKPAVFIVFDLNQYLNLLPYLSVAKYDWKQSQ